MKRITLLLSMLLLCHVFVQAQQPVATDTTVVVPPLMNFSGVLAENGKPMTGETAVTFLFYKEAQGGSPLWMESQNVKPDNAGHYSVMLGATSSQGLPAEIFVAGQAHWLAVQVQGQEEQPRVLLVSAPYALKAGDAETIGGLPPSAFVLAAPSNGLTATGASNSPVASNTSGSSTLSPASSSVTTSGGTANTIAMFTTATNIQNSILTQTGTTTVNVGGRLNLPTMGTATATTGFNSRPTDFVASVFNSGTATAVAQTFQWQAEPVNNGKTTASGLLSLLYATGTATPAETGLKINNKGVFTFAAGQTFPGTGSVTSVTAGSGLTGGTITKAGTISIPSAGVTNAMLQHSALTIAAGSDLTGGGAVSLGGTTTLKLDTTKVPTLAAANAFTNTDAFAASASGPEISVTNNGAGDGVDVVASKGDGVFSETNGFDGGDFVSFGTGYGMFSESVADANFAAAAAGWQFGTSKEDIGVWGYSGSTVGVGNYAEGYAASTEGSKCCGGAYSIGLWADTSGTSGSSAGIAALATVDTGYGVVSYSNSTDSTIWAENDVTGDSSAPVLVATGSSGYCLSTVSGNLTCTGTITPAVPVNGGATKVALYGVQAAENWFEDAGSGQLSNGAAVVRLESTFAQTVNTGMEYHVFLTPNGDCKGLYVSQKSPTSFEVHELGGGNSNIAFDYRIMAKRRGFESVRLEDRTAALAVRGPNRRAPGVRGPNPDEFRKAHQAKVDAHRTVAATMPATVNMPHK